MNENIAPIPITALAIHAIHNFWGMKGNRVLSGPKKMKQTPIVKLPMNRRILLFFNFLTKKLPNGQPIK